MIRLKRIWEKELRLKDHIEATNAKKVLIIFWHGLGDLVMFLNPFESLRKNFPNVEFDLAVQSGLGFEEITNEIDTNVLLIDGNFLNKADNGESFGYDIIADIDFPMNEGQTKFTKGEWCCIHELGIEPINGHKKVNCGVNRLIAIHYQITCLPDSCNPDRDTAEKIWNDVLDSGFIPIEMLFQHVFHNPVNKKFDFIDSCVRRCKPKVSSLVGLVQSCAGVICVVSGNLHIALSVLPPSKIFFLEKDFKLESFTKEADKIARADLRNYNHEVKEWLLTLK